MKFGFHVRTLAAAIFRVAVVTATVLTILFAALIIFSTLYQVVMTHMILPQEDEWSSLALFQSLVESGHWIDGMFIPHNEHEIFFPLVIMFTDYLIFCGHDNADIVVIFLFQSLTTALLLDLLRRSRAVSRGGLAVGAVVVALMFSLRQSENFVWGFQVSFVGVFASASLAIALFVSGLAPHRSRRQRACLLAAAYALATVSTFSMANGLLTGIVLVVLACLARARPGIVVGAAVAAAALIAGFSFGFRAGGDHHDIGDTARHVPRTLFFAAAYLGNFLDGDLRPAAWLGGAGFVGLGAMAVPLMIGRDRDPIRLTLIGLALFAAGSALITAIGRAPSGLGGAMSSRYATGAALFWSATLIAGWSILGRTEVRIATRALVCAAATVLVTACGTEQIPMGTSLEARAVAIGALEDGLMQDLYDEPRLQAQSEPVNLVRSLVPFLRDRGLSIFATRDTELLGRPLADAGATVSLACSGEFAAAEPAPTLGRDGVVVSGASGLRSRLREPRRVYIVDPDRRIVGLARTGYDGPEWRGYATAPSGTELRAFALLGSGRVCALGSVIVGG